MEAIIRQRFRKICVIQTAFIGDVILATPLIRVLSEHYPQAKIDFYTIPASFNWVESMSELNFAGVFDKRGQHAGLKGIWQFSRFLKKQHYDLAITPHRSLRTALLLKFAGIPRRIGFNKNALSGAFTDIVKYDGTIHEVERNLKLLEPLEIRIRDKVFPLVEFSDEDISLVQSWMEAVELQAGHFVCLAPGSVWNTKRWPGEKWEALADILKAHGIPYVWVGGEQDKKNVVRHLEKNPAPEAFGRFTLRQSAFLIQQSALLVSNDSAPTHMASAVGTPVITIFGPTVPEFGFGPYRENGCVVEIKDLQCRPCAIHGGIKCPEKHFRCMREISPQLVFKKIEEYIHVNFEN